MSRIGDKIKGLFRWVAVGTVDATDLPMLIDVKAGDIKRAKVESVNAFGFKAVPKAGDPTGEPFALMAGSGADAVAVAVVDFRYEPDDVTAGNACMYNATGQRLDLKAAGAVLNANMDATGYKAGSTPGLSGTLTIVDTGPLGVLGQAVIIFKGGIVTSIVCTPPAGTITWVATP